MTDIENLPFMCLLIFLTDHHHWRGMSTLTMPNNLASQHFLYHLLISTFGTYEYLQVLVLGGCLLGWVAWSCSLFRVNTFHTSPKTIECLYIIVSVKIFVCSTFDENYEKFTPILFKYILHSMRVGPFVDTLYATLLV